MPKPEPTPRRSRFHVAGSLFSCALFGCGLLWWDWPTGLILLGFWIEEVLSFLLTALKTTTLRQRLRGEGASAAGGCLVMVFFPGLHPIFILVFLFMDADTNPASDLLWSTLRNLLHGPPSWADPATLRALLSLIGGLLLWGVTDFVRDVRRARSAQGLTYDEIFARTKAALVLPHLTIIAGGFALVVLRLGSWLGMGLVLGKCMSELLLLPVAAGEVATDEKPAAA
jgi:hypothetical protein